MKKQEQVRTNQLQARCLIDRAQAHRSKASSAIYGASYAPMPANVATAKALVKKWEKAQQAALERKRKSARSRLDADFSKVRQDVLFLDPDAALKALQKFESRKYF